MPETITFLLPSLFDDRFQNSLDADVLHNNQSCLSRAKKESSVTIQKLLTEQYNLPDNYQNSACFMAIGHGLIKSSNTEKAYWLRADPIMLTVGHNGLFCRGNSVLNVNQDERQSLEKLINEHLIKDGLELIMFDSRQGYLKSNSILSSSFTPLGDVIGTEISNALPVGEDAAFWHGVLTDLQMLLHNCEVNLKRQERGEQTINGIWLWAESEREPNKIKNNDAKDYKLYTDESALSGALEKQVNLIELGTHFDDLQTKEKHIWIYSTEMLDASSQNDQNSWLTLYQYWFEHWIKPAINAVNEKKCRQLKIIADNGICYQYNPLSRWCFWR